MAALLELLNRVSFDNPIWIYLSLLIIILLFIDWHKKNNNALVNITDLDYLQKFSFFKLGRKRQLYRSAIWSILLFSLGMLLAGPKLHTSQAIFMGGEQIVYQKFLLMLDVSRSMSVPLGVENDVSLPGQAISRGQDIDEGEKIPRFQAARAALMDFVKRFDKAQIGLILFSAEPILARWPTNETKDLFWEVLEEDIGRGITSQIQSFSSLTNTDKALALSRKVFAQQGASEGAVILISDAEDDIENMGVAARNLRNDGIRVYTIGVGISEKIAESLSQKFQFDPGFRIFHVDSEDEMQEAYSLVAEVEESLPFDINNREYINELRWVMSLGFVVVAFVLLWGLEIYFHQSRPAGNKKISNEIQSGV
jgi:hypothetical protein